MNIWKIILFSIFLFIISYCLKSRNYKLFIENFFFNEETVEGDIATEEGDIATEEGNSLVEEEGNTLVEEDNTLVEEEGDIATEKNQVKKDKAQDQKTSERIAKKIAIDAAKKLLFKMGSGPFGWISLIITEVLKNVLNLDPKDFVDCPKGYYQADKLPKNIKRVISIVPGIGDVFSLLGNKLCIKLGCSNDQFNKDGLCYNKCRDGYKNIGPVCWKNCNQDIDLGTLCRTKCRDGYKEISGICYKNCSPGEKDIGIACVKK